MSRVWVRIVKGRFTGHLGWVSSNTVRKDGLIAIVLPANPYPHDMIMKRPIQIVRLDDAGVLAAEHWAVHFATNHNSGGMQVFNRESVLREVDNRGNKSVKTPFNSGVPRLATRI